MTAIEFPTTNLEDRAPEASPAPAAHRPFDAGNRRVALPAQVFFDPWLLNERMSTAHVYGALVAAEEASEGSATYDDVRRQLAMSRKAIGVHLRRLRDAGYLEPTPGRIRLRTLVRTARYPHRPGDALVAHPRRPAAPADPRTGRLFSVDPTDWGRQAS